MIDTTKGKMTARSIVDELTYINYKANRGYSPRVTPQEWAKIYANVHAMEARYQTELALAKAAS